MGSPPLFRRRGSRQVYEALLREIVSGRVIPGGRLPSEADLVTAVRRVPDHRCACVERAATGRADRTACGSGSFVAQKSGATARALSFGVLIPDFGDVEISPPSHVD